MGAECSRARRDPTSSQVDQGLAEHYGFTDERLDQIVGYRMSCWLDRNEMPNEDWIAKQTWESTA